MRVLRKKDCRKAKYGGSEWRLFLGGRAKMPLKCEKSEKESAALPEIAAPLLQWYGQHARVLPWRENKDPYRVWVSEIMLQQTRVEAVKPYYERFFIRASQYPRTGGGAGRAAFKAVGGAWIL